jgi:hypothetical protein
MKTHRTGLLVAAVLIAACLGETAGPALAEGDASLARAAGESRNSLVGMWEMTVTGTAVYLYKYAIGEGTWVAVGNIDQGFLDWRFSATMGAYTRIAQRSYSYRERGWTYSKAGEHNGSFESVGTFVLDESGTTFSGPGVFRMFDTAGTVIWEENLTVVATKVGAYRP